MLLTELKTATQSAHQQLHRIIRLDRLQASMDEYVRCLLGFLESLAPIERLLCGPNGLPGSPATQPSVVSSTASSSTSDAASAGVRDAATSEPKFDNKTAWLLSDLNYFGCSPENLCGLFDRDTCEWLKQLSHRNTARPVDRAQSSNAMPWRSFTPQNIDVIDALFSESESHRIGPECYGQAFDAPLDLADQVGMRYVLEGMTLGSTRIYPKIQSAHELDASSGLRFFRAYGELEDTQMRWAGFKTWAEQQDIDTTRAVAAATRTFHRFAAILGKWLPVVEGSTQ